MNSRSIAVAFFPSQSQENLPHGLAHDTTIHEWMYSYLLSVSQEQAAYESERSLLACPTRCSPVGIIGTVGYGNSIHHDTSFILDSFREAMTMNVTHSANEAIRVAGPLVDLHSTKLTSPPTVVEVLIFQTFFGTAPSLCVGVFQLDKGEPLSHFASPGCAGRRFYPVSSGDLHSFATEPFAVGLQTRCSSFFPFFHRAPPRAPLSHCPHRGQGAVLGHQLSAGGHRRVRWTGRSRAQRAHVFSSAARRDSDVDSARRIVIVISTINLHNRHTMTCTFLSAGDKSQRININISN